MTREEYYAKQKLSDELQLKADKLFKKAYKIQEEWLRVENELADYDAEQSAWDE
jgi:hypothetical protein